MELNREFQRVEDSVKAEQEKVTNMQASEINKKRILVYSVTVLLILTLILSFLLIKRQQRKRRAEKTVFEAETTTLIMEKDQKEKELARAKEMLGEHINALIEKNALLEQSMLEMEELKKQAEGKKIEYAENLSKSTILTEEDWSKFRQLFEQVHPDFFKRLKEKLPNLTQAEIRFMCLTKLQLGTNQMAGMLGVSLNTIRASRYQLRKKLGLSGKDDLNDIVNSI